MTIEYLRSFRIVGYAVFDLIVAFIGVYLLAPLLSKLLLKIRVVVPRFSWVLLTLPLGVLIHILVGTETMMVKNFLDINGHYGLKILMLILTVLGILKVRVEY